MTGEHTGLCLNRLLVLPARSRPAMIDDADRPGGNGTSGRLVAERMCYGEYAHTGGFDEAVRRLADLHEARPYGVDAKLSEFEGAAAG